MFIREDLSADSDFADSDEVFIHPRALVAKGAELGRGVKIGPNAVIGSQVTLHDRVQVGVGAVIEGVTTIGDETKVHAYATLGSDPQDLKYGGEETRLVIGSRNSIREYVNISVGTVGGGGITEVGDHNLLMAYTHVAHDCRIGNYCIFANGVQIAGHVAIDDRVVFGGMSGGHQFCRFGAYAMVGAGAIVVKDVVPYTMVQGDRAQVTGLNLVGLKRAGIRGADLAAIKDMFRIVFSSNHTLDDALVAIEQGVDPSSHREVITSFLSKSTRGICR